MNNFLDYVSNRRSVYAISDETLISDAQLKELVETTVKHTPSAFNSQTGRVILLLGDDHKKVWNITLEELRKVTPEDAFADTAEKIAGFAAGYGTVLFFEEQDTIKSLQENFPFYKDNFPLWSLQSSGMLQFAVWTALESEGYGASLQHYNPLIDEEIETAWNVPKGWKLLAQMPFGKATAPAGDKEYLPIESRFKVYGK